MSHTHHAAATSSPNFQLIFNNALKAYEKRTKNDLLAHPLAAQLQACDSPSAVLSVLQQQVQELNQSRSSNERLTNWLDPTVNVLYALSSALGEGVGLVFSPAKVIFAGVGVLLLAAKDSRASQDTLVSIFERMENFFQRLDVYIDVAPTPEMMNIIIKIMVEVLTILAIATKEIKQGRTKIFLKKLAGRTDIENALKRLDELTNEEARMATAQVLKATRIVDDRVKAVDNKIAEVVDDGKEAKVVLHQVKGNQLRENLRNWLSPPDPSTNHNIACAIHHKGSATWFFQGSMFNDWKSAGLLLWIHGKPGSGKSVLCSTIVQDVEAICETGQASMGYFYFDFRDAKKQHWRDMVPSLLVQLSSRSNPRCDILSRLYSRHDSGARQPSDDLLIRCLQEMLALPDEGPTYLIIDAVDECPNISGIPSPRERVLQFVEELVNLSLPKLHICVTSRPEIDIRNILEPLASCRVSLHDQSGQKQDIENYVRSVVYSDSEPIMRRWRKEDKDLVIKTLTERADGMFRWVFCQLDVLRHCLPPSVRRTLDELPESLDETYERVLKEIKKPNREHARRLLQCLVVAVRPLRLEELSEIIAFDFNDVEEIPKLNPSWRWEDQEQALLSSCSSLIAIVDANYTRVVQFSHFSVKEFLTSPRLGTSSGDISHYHIDLELAHTIFARACLSILLQLDSHDEESSDWNSFPLAKYAAEHWVFHAQYKDVSTHLRKGMEALFNPDKPHFSAWRQLHDINIIPEYDSNFYIFYLYPPVSPAFPLYYAALCGFHDLAKDLISKYPLQVNANGGFYASPLVAALNGKHFRTADLLRLSGAHPDVQGNLLKTPLHGAADRGDLEILHRLIEYNADLNAADVDGYTPLYQASISMFPRSIDAVRLFLEHGVDVNVRTNQGATALHGASAKGALEMVRMVLEHGANVQVKDDQGKTPHQLALEGGRHEITKLLSEYGPEDTS